MKKTFTLSDFQAWGRIGGKRGSRASKAKSARIRWQRERSRKRKKRMDKTNNHIAAATT